MTVTASKADHGHYITQLVAEQARWLADADTHEDGDVTLPDPHQLLDAALAACTAMTLRMYAERKGMKLDDVVVTIDHTEADGIYRIQRTLRLMGDLNDDERSRLTQIADRCPVHRSLSSRIEIHTELAD
jgi:putative redox protein